MSLCSNCDIISAKVKKNIRVYFCAFIPIFKKSWREESTPSVVIVRETAVNRAMGEVFSRIASIKTTVRGKLVAIKPNDTWVSRSDKIAGDPAGYFTGSDP